MTKNALRFIVVSVISVCTTGCTVPLGPWGGPAYDLNVADVGTGKQAITPRNDADYVGGSEINTKRK
jgi:hypothetical protein